MTPELRERLKQSCKLMAEKMPDKLKYEEDELGWTLYNFSQEECYVNFVLPKDKVYVFQDDIDVLASFLPKPRKLELHRHNGGFIVLFYHGNWEIMPFIIPMFVQANDKLTALIEGFCYEAERQLK